MRFAIERVVVVSGLTSVRRGIADGGPEDGGAPSVACDKSHRGGRDEDLAAEAGAVADVRARARQGESTDPS